MKKPTIVILAALLAGCGDYENKAKEDTQKAADQKALQGELVKSPVLDYRKYTEDSVPTAEPGKIAPKAAPGAKSASSGFKKTPVLDYRKYLVEDGKP